MTAEPSKETSRTRQQIGDKIQLLYEKQDCEVANGDGVGDPDFDEMDRQISQLWREFDAIG